LPNIALDGTIFGGQGQAPRPIAIGNDMSWVTEQIAIGSCIRDAAKMAEASLPKSGAASFAAPLFVWRSRNADYHEVTDLFDLWEGEKTGLRDPIIIEKRIQGLSKILRDVRSSNGLRQI
jgi:hypothetical protein